MERLSFSLRVKNLLYLGILILLVGFGGPFKNLIDLPVSFFLKNKLHLSSHETAIFRFIAAIPLYVSFLFGFLRDGWNPFGMRDRGFMVLFGAITAFLYAFFAFTATTYSSLLIALFILTISYRIVESAQGGLSSLMGQQHEMSGQVSALWLCLNTFPAMTGYFLGGHLSEWLDKVDIQQGVEYLFLIGAAIMTGVALFGLLKPKSIYAHLSYPTTSVTSWHAMRQLLKHKPLYLASLIWFLWQFAPGVQTPLQYYLQNTLKATDSDWGTWHAIFVVSTIPTTLLFGHLCRSLSLRRLLFLGTLIAVPQLVPLLWVESVHGAFIASSVMGLMSGMATSSYLSFLIRSCPNGFQGTAMMLYASLYYVSWRAGDLLGTYLFDYYGNFTVCVIATTVVYALIIPILFWIPRQLIDKPDG